MIPFCLIINSHRRLVPHIPADAARQSGCAGRRARHEVGSKEKLILLLLLTEVVSGPAGAWVFLPAAHCPNSSLNSADCTLRVFYRNYGHCGVLFPWEGAYNNYFKEQSQTIEQE